MAHDVMTFTNRLADQNRTILATIHQVRRRVFPGPHIRKPLRPRACRTNLTYPLPTFFSPLRTPSRWPPRSSSSPRGAWPFAGPPPRPRRTSPPQRWATRRTGTPTRPTSSSRYVCACIRMRASIGPAYIMDLIDPYLTRHGNTLSPTQYCTLGRLGRGALPQRRAPPQRGPQEAERALRGLGLLPGAHRARAL